MNKDRMQEIMGAIVEAAEEIEDRQVEVEGAVSITSDEIVGVIEKYLGKYLF